MLFLSLIYSADFRLSRLVSFCRRAREPGVGVEGGDAGEGEEDGAQVEAPAGHGAAQGPQLHLLPAQGLRGRGHPQQGPRH